MEVAENRHDRQRAGFTEPPEFGQQSMSRVSASPLDGGAVPRMVTNVGAIVRVMDRTTNPSTVDFEQNISWKLFRLRRTTVHLDIGTATDNANTELWIAKKAGSWAMSMPR